MSNPESNSPATASNCVDLETDSDVNLKEQWHLDWDEYFMAVAFLTAKRSKDPCTKVGACIVNNSNKIVGTGYNGMPLGCDDDKFSWAKKKGTMNNKHLYVCHAEMNAILNKNALDVKGCTLYVALFPCNECAKIIIQSEIKHVVYMSDKYSYKLKTMAAKKMFDAANITYRQHNVKNKQIVIDFTDLEPTKNGEHDETS